MLQFCLASEFAQSQPACRKFILGDKFNANERNFALSLKVFNESQFRYFFLKLSSNCLEEILKKKLLTIRLFP